MSGIGKAGSNLKTRNFGKLMEVPKRYNETAFQTFNVKRYMFYRFSIICSIGFYSVSTI